MTATLRRTIRLHRAQARFRRSKALYRAFVGGRGAGKSWVGAYDLLRRVRRDRTYLVGSPTGVLMQDTTFPTFRAIAQDLGILSDVRLTPYPNATIRVGDGEATIRFRTAENPERMRGPNLSGVWLDEASLMAPAAYTVCIAALREAGEQGWLSATLTPKGLTHWTYDLFGKPRPDTEVIHARTSDNPFLPAEFAATLAKQYAPNLARQELGGEFLAIEGAEWPAEYFDHAAFWFTDWPADLAIRTLSLDPSKGKDSKSGDYSAFVKFGRDGAGTEYVEADLAQGRDAEAIVDAGVEHVRQFHPDGFALEENAFQHLFAPLFRARALATRTELPIYLMNNTVNKQVRIRRLTEPLKAKCIRFRDTPGTRLLVQQLRDFPVGTHDDGPDALEGARRLAIDLHNQGPLPRGVRHG